MTGKHVIITGATGMIGGCVLRLCLDNPNVAKVTVIGRRPVGIEHTELRNILNNDFMDEENEDALQKDSKNR